jgi:hypothetical protein
VLEISGLIRMDSFIPAFLAGGYGVSGLWFLGMSCDDLGARGVWSMVRVDDNEYLYNIQVHTLYAM